MSSPSRIVLIGVIDVVLIVVFAVTGRASHAESLTVGGVWTTAWPFLAALVAGWLVTLAWRRPAAPWRTGVPIWLVTLVGGMLLRVVSGQGTAVPFILVATGFLLLTLVGWRLVAALAVRARHPQH